MPPHKWKPIKRKVGTYKPMTVCIAGICDHPLAPKIVFCADRLVTNQDGLTFEQGRPKIDLIRDNCLVMNAGRAAEADMIIFAVRAKLKEEPEKNHSIAQIAEMFSQEHKQEKLIAIEEDILTPRGMNLNSFYAGIKNLPDWLAFAIDRQIQEYDFGVEFLVLGFDFTDDGHETYYEPYLYHIDRNGKLQPLNSVGFGIIGIGNVMSLPEMTRNTYKTNMTFSEALVRVFWAKKSAERVVSVGTETTDLGLLWVEVDGSGKVEARNTLVEDEFKKQLLEGYRDQTIKMNQTTAEIEQNVSRILAGEQKVPDKAT